MATSSELKRTMILNGHKAPKGDHGDNLQLHVNKTTGERWCYCESCQALAALDADGRMYGEATIKQCRGHTRQPRASAYMTT